MNKRFGFIGLLLALCLCFTACGGSPEQTSSTEPDQTVPTTAAQAEATPDEAIPHNTLMLFSHAEPVVDMESVKQEHYDNGTYYYMDASGDDAVRCISSCYLTTLKDGETEEDYATRRAIGLSTALTPGTPYDLTVSKNDALSDALGYPVYLVSYFTGGDLNTVCWTVYLTRTEHYSYQYAFAAEAKTSLQIEDRFMDYFCTLKLETMAP